MSTMNDTSYINNGDKFSKLRLIPYGDSKNKTPKLEAYGEIGFGIIATDKNDYAPNKKWVISSEFISKWRK